MKKLFGLFMCVVLLLSITACGGGKTENNTEAANKTTQPTETTTLPETTEPVKRELARGTISEDVYTNDFVGFTFTKPAEWTFLSDEEIGNTVNRLQQDIDLSDLEKALDETPLFIDMAVSDGGKNSLQIAYQKTENLSPCPHTLDEYAEQVKTTITDPKITGASFISSENVKLGNVDFKKLNFDFQGETTILYASLVDKYGILVVPTIESELTETQGPIEAMFK